MVDLNTAAEVEQINRKIIKVGNSYAVSIAPSKAVKFGFELGTKVQVEISNGLIQIIREGKHHLNIEKQLITRELYSMDAISKQPLIFKVNKHDLQGLNEVSHDLGMKSLAWINQRINGYNSNLRLGEKRRRAVIRGGQVVVLNFDFMTIPRFPISINGNNFPALKGLRMSCCQLREVDLNTVENLHSLEKLVLSKNEIDEIDLTPLSNLSELNTLFLDNNLLDQINLEPLKNQKKMETIYLNNNELEKIDLSPLNDLTRLKEIYLDNNFLFEVDLTPLSKIKDLYLNLSSNNLENLDISPLSGTSNLTLLLEKNPFKEIDLEPLNGIDNLYLGLPENLSKRTLNQIKILQDKGAKLSLKATKKLSTGEIYSLPQELREIALVILALEKGTVEEIAKEIGKSVNVTLEKVNSLQKMGYVGMTQSEGKKVYLISS